MDLTTIIIFTTISILIAAITLGITMARRTEAPKRRPVPGGDLHPLNPAAAEGITYKNKYRPKAKNTPPSLTIEADFGFPAPIIFKVESKMERFGKAIGLANEVQTGDQAFDEAVYVDSPYPDYAAAMLADSDNRRAIRSCFAAQPQLARIECLPEQTKFFISPAAKGQLTPEEAKALLAALPGLRQTVSRLQLTRSAFREKIGRWVIIATAGLSLVGFAALAVGLSVWPSLDDAIFGPALLAGLAGTAIWSLLAWLVLRGRSGALLPFIVAFAIGICDFTTLGIGATHIANGVLATAPVQSHPVTITGKHISRGKNSTTYYLEFSPWRDGMDTRISVASSWYDARNAGDSLIIDSRMGGLGYEILIDYRE